LRTSAYPRGVARKAYRPRYVRLAAMSLEVAIEKLDGNTAVVTVSGPLSLGTKLKVLDAQLQQLASDGFSRIGP